MRVPHPSPRSRHGRPAGHAVSRAFLAVLLVAACGSASPSPTVRPELAWSRATIDLPADVVDLAPGTSGGMICSPCHAEQASLMTGVTPTGDGLLAVGQQLPPSTAVAYRSADGMTWDPEAGFAPAEDTAALAAAADGARQVIVGRHGPAAAAWALAPGEPAWRAAPDAPSLHGSGTGTAVMQAVTSWQGRFVAAGWRTSGTTARTAAIWTSDDGLAWELASTGPGFEDAAVFGIAGSDAGLVAVGATGEAGTGPAAVWASADGRAWSRVDAASFAAGPMRTVARAGVGFVAGGFASGDDRAVAWSSTDGQSWVEQPASGALTNAGRAIRMLALAPDGDGLLAAGWQSDAGNGSGVIWTSPDGDTWVRLPDQVSISGASLAGVALIGSMPIAVGTSGYPDNDQASAWYEGP